METRLYSRIDFYEIWHLRFGIDSICRLFVFNALWWVDAPVSMHVSPRWRYARMDVCDACRPEPARKCWANIAASNPFTFLVAAHIRIGGEHDSVQIKWPIEKHLALWRQNKHHQLDMVVVECLWVWVCVSGTHVLVLRKCLSAFLFLSSVQAHTHTYEARFVRHCHRRRRHRRRHHCCAPCNRLAERAHYVQFILLQFWTL